MRRSIGSALLGLVAVVAICQGLINSKYVRRKTLEGVEKAPCGPRREATPGRLHTLRMVSTEKPAGSRSVDVQATTAGFTDAQIRPAPIKATAHDLYTGRDPARVKIFDTTLRDGEQSPGCTMNTEEKMLVAAQLAKLGVDVIEAGFPVASEGDFEAVSKIAMTVGQLENPPIICGLARALKKDISVCYDAIKHAKFPRIHTFIATSDIHMEHKLKKTRAEVLEITKEMVSHAASLCKDIEFSAEDALRSDPEFLYQVYSVAIASGATTINVPDTVGYTTPAEFYKLIRGLRENVKGIDGITISVHGHNDLGMAVANFLAAVEGGARQLECTINGIGERAGNAALEELVMALHVRKSYFNRFFSRADDSEVALTNVKTNEIYKSSRLVSTITGMVVQANKAIVGANAFAHESGIHQDGVLKNKRTYEIMDADSIGKCGGGWDLCSPFFTHCFSYFLFLSSPRNRVVEQQYCPGQALGAPRLPPTPHRAWLRAVG